MSQHDFNIANQGFPATRADINNALAALASTSSGDIEPSTTFANQLWYDTANNLLKFRNEADSAWITFAYLDQATNEWELRSAAIQAVDSAGVSIKTDDGTTRFTINDDGSATFTGTVTADGLTVDGAIQVNATVPSIVLEETDTTDINGQVAVVSGNTHIRTINDAGNSVTNRFTVSNSTGDISFYEDTGTTAKFFWDASAESLGIGTSGPADPLHVYTSDSGVARLESTSANSYLRFITSTDTNGYVGYESNDMVIYANNSKVATFNSSGNLLVGTTSQVSSEDKLTVSGTTNVFTSIAATNLTNGHQVSAIFRGYYGGSQYAAAMGVYKNTAHSVPAFYTNYRNGGSSYYLWADASGVFRTSSNGGYIGTTTGTVVGTQTSDERLKQIDDDFSYGLNHVMQLKPISYVFTDDVDQKKTLGFGAQTTQTIIPEAVYDSGVCIDGYDEDSDSMMQQTPKSDRTKLMMDGIQLVPVLVKAIQEQQATIEALEARITALESA